MNFLTDNIFLIYILPMIAAITAFSGYYFKFLVSEDTVKKTSLVSNTVCLIFSVILIYSFLIEKANENFSVALNWLSIENLSVSMGVLIDKFSVIFWGIFLLISLVIQIFSMKFFENSEKRNLFIGLFNLFVLFMTGFIFSSNLIQAVIFSSLTGADAYLLLNLNFEKINVSEEAKKYFILDKIGDVLFLTAIIIFIYFTRAYELYSGGELLGFTDISDIASDFYVYMSDINFYTVGLIVFAGILAKAGIFPFHNKLSSAVCEYNPVVFLIYTALPITGLMFFVRLTHVFYLSQILMNTIFYVLIFAFIYSAIFAFTQKFEKKEEAYTIACRIPLLTGLYFNQSYKILIVFGVLFFSFVLFMLTVKFHIRKDLNYNGLTNRKISIDGDIADKILCWLTDNIYDIVCNFAKFVDKYVISMVLNSIGYVTRFVSWLNSFLQNGKIQQYLVYSVVATSLILFLYIITLIGAGEV